MPIVLAAPIAALFGQRALVRHVFLWTAFTTWCVRRVAGARIVEEGAMPDGPVLFVSKHESFFEALDFIGRLRGPAVVMKRELQKIPVWGWATNAYGAIAVDRSASSKALRAIVKAGAAARAEGRSVLIFAEGTRVAIGTQPPLKSGFAGLYRALNLPVVPIAVQSGHVWLRNGSVRPGVIRIRYGAPIPPGLPRDEIEARVHAAINALPESERR